ncbi:MAG: methyltransferase domain-containing protein [Rhodospirillales bacterium]|nr:methyltransferase domain-containing protein [Rhodospirillales bacterium]
MGDPQRFWDRYAKGYAKRPIADEAAYQTKLKLTQEHLKPDMEVLEFGCGTGTITLHHAPFVKHIRAIDISKNMIEISKTKARDANVTNVAFEQLKIDDLKENDSTYDVVMGHSILHLLDDKEKAINKVHRLLKPGGLFISTTTCLGGKLWALRAILPIGHFFGLLPMVKFFTKEELETALKDNGFQIDHIWQSGKPKGIFIIARKTQ